MPHIETLHLKSNQTVLSASHAIVMLSLSMYSIFQPVYLYTNGVPLLGVIGFEIFFWSLSLLAVIPNFYSVSRLGIRGSMVVSIAARLSLFAYLASLGSLLTHFPVWVVLCGLGVLHQVAVGHYWVPFHSLFAHTFTGKHQASGLGKLSALSQIGAIIAPLIGGFLLVTLPPMWFFLIVGAGFTIGSCGYFFLKLEVEDFMHVYPRRVVQHCFRRENFPYFTEGLIDRAQAFIWPLLLTLRDISLAVMGALFTFTNLVRTVICLLIGNTLDRHTDWMRMIQSFGMAVMSVSLFVRGFFFNILLAGIGQSAGGIGQTIFTMPTVANMYLKANPSDITTPIAVREIVYNFGRLVASILAFVLVLLYQGIIGLSVGLFFVGVWCAVRSFQLYFAKK